MSLRMRNREEDSEAWEYYWIHVCEHIKKEKCPNIHCKFYQCKLNKNEKKK